VVTEGAPVGNEDNPEDGVVVAVNAVVVDEDEDRVGMGQTVQEDRIQKYVVVGVDNT
jgi:hypothetical protein